MAHASSPRLRTRLAASPRGFSLIVAMVMLAAVGLASIAVMRDASSAAAVASNNRLQAQAARWAELALGFCERQLTFGPAVRRVPTLPVATPGAWGQRASWTNLGAAKATTLGAADLDSTVAPRVAPQCLVEGPLQPDVYRVTARGFSPDFRANASGATRDGAVVWLQSTVLLGDVTPDPAGCHAHCAAIRQRLWQQLLTPPF